MIFADPEKAAIAKHRVSNFSGHLVDHHAFDTADPLAISAIDCSAFNAIASDEIV